MPKGGGTNVKVALPPVDHFALIVKDLDETMRFYSSVFGLQWSRIGEHEVKEAMLRGRPSPFKAKVAFAQMGGTQIELIQVLEGESPDLEFLRNKGEGVSHLGFHVSDLENALAEFAKQGIKPILKCERPAGISFAFLSDDRLGGVMIELFQRNSG